MRKKMFVRSLLILLLLSLLFPVKPMAVNHKVLEGTLYLEGVPDPECHCPGSMKDCICIIPMRPKD
ncbi:MAG: hypothetical protein RB296_05415 [Acidobacteriota bacterium]|nr:hypothetical protein [Acidobacteriota bacterium]